MCQRNKAVSKIPILRTFLYTIPDPGTVGGPNVAIINDMVDAAAEDTPTLVGGH
jgi:hypothetical protein